MRVDIIWHEDKIVPMPNEGPPPTERLYLDDPLRCAFDAHVLGHGRFGEATSVILERTAFYPESGGQMADRGTLGGQTVRDVQVQGGLVHHLLDGPLPEVGAALHGEVDAARRRVHMALHTGQHILSRALVEVARAETRSARLGETRCTLDVERPAFDDHTLARVEELTNAVIDDDLAVDAYFPDPAALATLPLRKEPTVEGPVRVVAIADFDVTPCGGTHCRRTAQVGLVHIDALERYKGGTRITFSAGGRARARLREQSALLDALGRTLTCGPTDVPAALTKLQRDLATSREALGGLRDAYAALRAAELLREARDVGGDAVVVACLDGADVELLRAVAQQVVSAPQGVALLAAPTEGGAHVLAARGQQSAFDCRAFMAAVTRAAGGRGGGRPERAEGRIPDASGWAERVFEVVAVRDT